MAVAEAGSFSAAAEKLCCVQSNVTARIRKLETFLGGTVFERSKAGARLTPLGDRLFDHATDLINRFDAAEADLLDAAGGAAPLRLGTMQTTLGARLPALLKSLGDRLPNAPITLNAGPTAYLLRNLWERQLDAAFVTGPVDPDRFHACEAFDETLVLVERADKPGSDTLLAFRDGCSYRSIAQSWLRESGRSDTPVRDMGSLEGILGCVEAGLGFAVAPQAALGNYRPAEAFRLSTLPRHFAEAPTVLAWRIDTRPTRTLHTLMDILSETPAIAASA